MAWIAVEHFTTRPTVTVKRADPMTNVIGTEIYTVSPRVPGDPQVHTHTIVPNVMVTESGRIVAVDRRDMSVRKKEYGAVYQAFLANNLRKLGVSVELDPRTDMAKLSDIPEAVCHEFSKRTNDADVYARREAKRRGMDWDAMSDTAKVAFLKGGAKASRKAKRDDLSNFEAWALQAEQMGWRYETVIKHQLAPEKHQIPDEEHQLDRLNQAYETALPFLNKSFKTRAVISRFDANAAAARGLIAHGIETTADISTIVSRMTTDGIEQDGKRTPLEVRGDKITTGLHHEQEQELIRLVQAAYEDRSCALTAGELAEAEIRTGIDFSGDLGELQRDTAGRMGRGGAFGVFIGAAGTGKTDRVLRLVADAHNSPLTKLGSADSLQQ